MSNTIWVGKVERDLIQNISDIIWNTNAPDRHKLDAIEGYLYEYEQIMDHATEEQERHWAEVRPTLSRVMMEQ